MNKWFSVSKEVRLGLLQGEEARCSQGSHLHANNVALLAQAKNWVDWGSSARTEKAQIHQHEWALVTEKRNLSHLSVRLCDCGHSRSISKKMLQQLLHRLECKQPFILSGDHGCEFFTSTDIGYLRSYNTVRISTWLCP